MLSYRYRFSAVVFSIPAISMLNILLNDIATCLVTHLVSFAGLVFNVVTVIVYGMMGISAPLMNERA